MFLLSTITLFLQINVVITRLKCGWNLTKHVSNIRENLFFDYSVKNWLKSNHLNQFKLS